jgi:DNA polymerase-3 subunit delta
MSRSAPVVYLLQGEDELAMARFISDLQTRLGDPSLVSMNVTRLDATTFHLNELLSLAAAMPFLTRRRIVILEDVLPRLVSQADQVSFTTQLEKLPDTTALLIVEHHPLSDAKDKARGKLHWMERWVQEAGDLAITREFNAPKGDALVGWIQESAIKNGGKFTGGAARQLLELVGDEPRLMEQEINKLLMYVNNKRPVEAEDVKALTAEVVPGDIFELVDALAEKNGRTGSALMVKLLEKQEPLAIFAMIVRQFRLLLMACEALDRQGPGVDLAQALHVHPFVARKVGAQVRRFTMPALEAIYRRLLEVDEAIKTSQIDGDIALQTLVVSLTRPG